MKNTLKPFWLFLFLILVFSSCKTYRNVENLKPKTSKDKTEVRIDRTSIDKLIPGDEIIVNTVEGFTYNMIFRIRDGIYLVGNVQKVNSEKLPKPEALRIPIEEIETLKVKRVSPAATTVAGVLGAAALFFVGLMIVLATSDPWW